MANPIAFNPQDRFVVGMGDTLLVTTQNGSVFGHDLTGHTAGRPFQFDGARAAFNPVDRFVVTLGNLLIVTTQSGDVFGHELNGRTIGPAFKFEGAKAAFNAVDRFVTTIGNLLVVTTQNGDVFGHEISGRTIGPGFKFAGSKAAFNQVDRFVVSLGNMLIVTTQNGDVFGHDVVDRTIGPGFKLTGSRMAFNPQDRFVVMVRNAMIVTTRSGPAFGAEVIARDIGAIYRLNPDQTIRVHFKIWSEPTRTRRDMLVRMQDIFAAAGIGVVVASEQDFTSRSGLFTSLRDLDVDLSGKLTNEQVQLFNNRDNVDELDLAIHFVRTTLPPLNGIAVHPEDLFGAVVTQDASFWTLAHEIAHVMGISHVGGEHTNCADDQPDCCSTPMVTRLMTGCSTSKIVGNPTLDQGEIDALRRNRLAQPS